MNYGYPKQIFRVLLVGICTCETHDLLSGVIPLRLLPILSTPISSTYVLSVNTPLSGQNFRVLLVGICTCETNDLLSGVTPLRLLPISPTPISFTYVLSVNTALSGSLVQIYNYFLGKRFKRANTMENLSINRPSYQPS